MRVGLYGPRGGGVAERDGVMPSADRDRGHAGQGVRRHGRLYRRHRRRLCDFVRSFASGFIFTTSLPPAIAAGALASVRHLKREPAERDRVTRSASPRLRALLDARRAAGDADNPAISCRCMVGDPVLCKQISDELLDRLRHLCPADQLPDRAARHRAAAHHAVAVAHRRGYRPSGRCAARHLEPSGATQGGLNRLGTLLSGHGPTYGLLLCRLGRGPTPPERRSGEPSLLGVFAADRLCEILVGDGAAAFLERLQRGVADRRS